MAPRLITASTPATHRLASLGLAALLMLVTASGCPSQPDNATSPAPVAERAKKPPRPSRPAQAEPAVRNPVAVAPKVDVAGPAVIDLTAVANAGLAPPAEPNSAAGTPTADAGATIDANGEAAAPTNPNALAQLAGPEATPTPPGDQPAEVQAPPAPTPPGTLDPATCRAACDNALTVTLAELPDTTAPSMREELKRVLDTECPSRCLAKASVESAQCIANARSALALASCP